jgi:hypothetical protein
VVAWSGHARLEDAVARLRPPLRLGAHPADRKPPGRLRVGWLLMG